MGGGGGGSGYRERGRNQLLPLFSVACPKGRKGTRMARLDPVFTNAHNTMTSGDDHFGRETKRENESRNCARALDSKKKMTKKSDLTHPPPLLPLVPDKTVTRALWLCAGMGINRPPPPFQTQFSHIFSFSFWCRAKARISKYGPRAPKKNPPPSSSSPVNEQGGGAAQTSPHSLLV